VKLLAVVFRFFAAFLAFYGLIQILKYASR